MASPVGRKEAFTWYSKDQVHATEAADGTAASAVAAPLTSGFAAYGGLAQTFTPPPRFFAWASRR